jgi:flagellar P-ring protein FlgI
MSSGLCDTSAFASDADRKVLIRDVTQIQGVRDNQLVGYGLAIGLKNTGDTQQTFFTVQTLANSLQRMGVQIAPGVVVVKNVAAVFVTATLPPFARPGMKIDVTVSSVGDAKSIQGGVLLLTALRAANGEVYAEAQGPLVIGGYSEGASGNSKSVNQPTVGRIAEGATVERDAAVDLSRFRTVSLLLLNSDFTAARDVADVINKEFGKPIATALDSRRIDVDVAASGAPFGADSYLACPEPFHQLSFTGQGGGQRTYRNHRDGRRRPALAGLCDPGQPDHRRRDQSTWLCSRRRFQTANRR